jgi:hypothetical protein
MNLLDRVRDDMVRRRMTEPGCKVVVAVSGGPDSVALLHILCLLKDELEISLHIAHLNHMLRGEESEDDARFVAGLAQSYGLPVTVESIDVPAYPWMVGQVTLAFVMRSNYEPLLSLGPFSNKALDFMLFSVAAFLLIALGVPAVGSYIKLTPIQPLQFAAVAVFAFIMIFWQEIIKVWRYRKMA